MLALPGLIQEKVDQKMLYRLAQIADVTCEGIRDAVDEILNGMGRAYVSVELELLIAPSRRGRNRMADLLTVPKYGGRIEPTKRSYTLSSPLVNVVAG